MFGNFIERRNMERLVWFIMSIYRNLFYDKGYNNGKTSAGTLLLEVAMCGIFAYSKEKNINPMHFCEMFLQELNEHTKKNKMMSFEKICYIAAAMRGDFSKNVRQMGEFFGVSARKLDLGTDVFMEHEMMTGPALAVTGKMILLRIYDISPRDHVQNSRPIVVTEARILQALAA